MGKAELKDRVVADFEMERLSLCVMANSTAEVAFDECMSYVKFLISITAFNTFLPFFYS